MDGRCVARKFIKLFFARMKAFPKETVKKKRATRNPMVSRSKVARYS